MRERDLAGGGQQDEPRPGLAAEVKTQVGEALGEVGKDVLRRPVVPGGRAQRMAEPALGFEPRVTTPSVDITKFE
jgi:hypothetical protein